MGWHTGIRNGIFSYDPGVFIGIYACLRMIYKKTALRQKVERKVLSTNDFESTEADMGAKNGYVVLCVWAIIALLSGFITKEVNVNRINLFHYAQIIYISLGIRWVARYSRQACAVIMSLLVLLSVIYVREYFTDYAMSFDSWDAYSYNFTKALRDTAQRECEVFYITPSSQHPNAKDVSEIDTVYIHGLDMAYFMGKTNRSGGRELNPYPEQYQYSKASELKIDATINAVYLINEEDRNLFPEEQFVVKQYKQFCVVVPRQYE